MVRAARAVGTGPPASERRAHMVGSQAIPSTILLTEDSDEPGWVSSVRGEREGVRVVGEARAIAM